jgi:hypothetical protein
MKPITPFNYWLINKVLSYLSAKEGCVTEVPEYTDKGIRTTVRDAFGYVYEIQIRTIGRNTGDLEVLHEKVSYIQNIKLAIPETARFE